MRAVKLAIDRPSTSGGRVRAAKMRIRRVRRDESLRLRRDGREDALLVETCTVRTTAVLSGLEPRASNLLRHK